MVISGDEAKRFNAVRLDSFANINTGELVEANEETGFVKWKDGAGVINEKTFGAHVFRLALRSTLGR